MQIVRDTNSTGLSLTTSGFNPLNSVALRNFRASESL